MEPTRATGGRSSVTEDGKAIEVRVPTTTSPFAERVTESGELVYRYHFVVEEEPGNWNAATLNEPVRTTEFDPEIHHITQTLSFWPALPDKPVRYGVVVEQEGDWQVTQEVKAGKEKTHTSFADPADEKEFVKVLNTLPAGVRAYFYESSLNPDTLTPVADRLGKLLEYLKENGQEDLLAAPMNTVGKFKSDKWESTAAFCGRVGNQFSPGELTPLGLSLDRRAGVAGELMYTPDTLDEIRAAKYADRQDRLDILRSLGLDTAIGRRFEFFMHSSTAVYEGPGGLDRRIRVEEYTRDLYLNPFSPQESAQVGADSSINLLEFVPVVKNELFEGEISEPRPELDTFGKLLAYYAALDPMQLGQISWDCPQIAARLEEIKEEADRARSFFADRYGSYGGLDLGGTRGGPLSFGSKGGGFGVASTLFGETRNTGRSELRSVSGVSLQLDPVQIRLIVQY